MNPALSKDEIALLRDLRLTYDNPSTIAVAYNNKAQELGFKKRYCHSFYKLLDKYCDDLKDEFPQWISSVLLKKFLGITKDRIQAWRKSGLVKTQKINGVLCFQVSTFYQLKKRPILLRGIESSKFFDLCGHEVPVYTPTWKTAKKVLCIATGKTYTSISEGAMDLGFERSSFRNLVRSGNGFVFI